MTKLSLAISIATLLSAGTIEAATVEVDIKKFQFIPQQLTISVGDTVKWNNIEKRQYHSVWFEQLGEEESEYFFPDESYQRTFEQAGSFPYRCGPHEKMTGLIVVK